MTAAPARLCAILAAAILTVAPAPARSHADAARAVASPALSDLRSLDELRTAFNRDAGKVRLVLLLSPT